MRETTTNMERFLSNRHFKIHSSPLSLAMSLAAVLCMATPGAALAEAPKSFTVGEFLFERPDAWLWIETTSPMRKAELHVPSGDGASRAEITFFHFGPGQGGSVDANIARWISQFQEPVETIQPQIEKGLMGKVPVTFVKAKGTFLSGMPGQPTTPMKDYALHGAIIESAQGDVYVKMTGPLAIVEASGTIFDQFIKQAAASVANVEPEPDQPRAE